MKTFTETVTNIINKKVECPLPLEIIPNNMGINLCAVDRIHWEKQNDGQLKELTIYFIPENDSRPIEQQVSREVGGQCGAEKNIVKDIATIINQHSRENASNTPDFILAEYLERCLITFEMASNAREKWYGKKLSIGGTDSQLSG